MASDDSWTYALDVSIAHVRAFTSALSSLRLARRQRAKVRADASGLAIATSDDSKTCHASANFRSETFRSYALDETAARMASGGGARGRGASFEIDLAALIDVLGAFQGKDGDAEARVRWPSRSGALTIELECARGTGERELRQGVCAEIMPEVSAEGSAETEMSFRDEANAFMMPTGTLKEIVDDLEWPSGDVDIEIDENLLKFSAHGAEIGDLTVDVDVSEGRLTEFTCREPSVSRYKYRFLKSATSVGANFLGSGVAGGGDDTVTMTRVSVSSVGFLKVVHLLHLSRNRMSFTSGGINESMVPVTFIVNPVEDIDDDADGEDEE